MNNAAKIAGRVKPKKQVVRTRKVKVDLAKLAPAIIDGKLILKVKDRVFFERTLYGRTAIHEGFIFSIEDDAFTVWDETKGQFASVGYDRPDKVKSVQEVAKGDRVNEEGLIRDHGDERGDADKLPAVVEETAT